MAKQTDILNFEYSTRGIRDIGIVEPVLSYLELKYNLTVVRKSISDNFCKLIDEYHPKVIVTAHGIGTTNHHEMVKYASMKGIKVITFIAEGDMVDIKENVEILFWGNNKDRFFYEFANLQWSEKNVNLIRKHIPETLNYNLICTGGTGFDRYQFLPLKSKETFLTEHPKFRKYKHIVGIAGFPFYFFLSDLYKKDGKWVDMHLDHDACDMIALQKEPLRLMYRDLIKNNPDILFILKYHPAEIMRELSEFYQLDEFENVLNIHKEETIDNVINVSDVWLGFESTTCMEAWLLGKITFIANPENKEFVRSIISKGSPHYGSFETLNKAMHDFLSSGHSEDFNRLEAERNDAIQQVIGFGDGCNHKRAAEYIYSIMDAEFIPKTVDINYINTIEKKYSNIEFRKKLRHLLYKTPLVLIPKVRKEKEKDLKKTNEFNAELRQEFADMYRKALTEFHKKTGALH